MTVKRIAALLFVFSLFPVTAQAQECVTEGMGNMTWIFSAGANDQIASGDVIRAYTADGQCVGESVWQDGQSVAVAVIGGEAPGDVYLNNGDTINWRVGVADTSYSMGDFQYTDTAFGPPIETYQADYMTRVTSFGILIPTLQVPITRVGFRSDTYVSNSEEWMIPLDISAPADDTTTAYNLVVVGADSSDATGGYVREEVRGDTLVVQALDTYIYGGDIPNGVVLRGGFDGAETDTVEVAHFDAVLGDRKQESDIEYIATQTVVYRYLRGDANGDLQVDFSDVVWILDKVDDFPYSHPAERTEADLDRDGLITFIDAVLLALRVL